MADGLIAEAEVPQGQIGSGTAFILGDRNPAMDQFEKDMIKRDKRRAAEAQSKADAIKKMGDFEAIGWYKHNTELKGMVDGIKKSFVESMVKGVNPMDASNVEAYMKLNQDMKDAKAAAEYSKQIKDAHGKIMKELTINAHKYTPESIEAAKEFYDQPLLAQMTAPLPQLDIVEEETPWWEAANKITATYIDDTRERGTRTVATRKADIEAIRTSVGAFLDGTPEGKQAIEELGGREEALNHITEKVIAPKVKTSYKETFDEPRTTGGKDKKTLEDMTSRKVLINKILAGDDISAGEMMGKRHGGGNVTNVWFEETPDGKIMNVEFRTGSGKRSTTSIETNDPGARVLVNTIIEGKAGVRKFDPEELAKVPAAEEFQTENIEAKYDELTENLSSGDEKTREDASKSLKGRLLNLGRKSKEVKDVEVDKARFFGDDDLVITFKDGSKKTIVLNEEGKKEVKNILKKSKIFTRGIVTPGEEKPSLKSTAEDPTKKPKKVKTW